MLFQWIYFHLAVYLLSESTYAAGVSTRDCLDRVNDAAPQMAFVKSAAGRKVVSSLSLALSSARRDFLSG